LFVKIEAFAQTLRASALWMSSTAEMRGFHRFVALETGATS
jgi:hypothetical protein